IPLRDAAAPAAALGVGVTRAHHVLGDRLDLLGAELRAEGRHRAAAVGDLVRGLLHAQRRPVEVRPHLAGGARRRQRVARRAGGGERGRGVARRVVGLRRGGLRRGGRGRRGRRRRGRGGRGGGRRRRGAAVGTEAVGDDRRLLVRRLRQA